MSISASQLESLVGSVIAMLPKTGELTTEFKQARSAGRFALALFVLGLLISGLSTLTPILGQSKIGLVLGIALAALSVVMHALTNMVYIKGRVDVKASIPAILQGVKDLTDVVGSIAVHTSVPGALTPVLIPPAVVVKPADPILGPPSPAAAK